MLIDLAPVLDVPNVVVKSAVCGWRIDEDAAVSPPTYQVTILTVGGSFVGKPQKSFAAAQLQYGNFVKAYNAAV